MKKLVLGYHKDLGLGIHTEFIENISFIDRTIKTLKATNITYAARALIKADTVESSGLKSFFGSMSCESQETDAKYRYL